MINRKKYFLCILAMLVVTGCSFLKNEYIPDSFISSDEFIDRDAFQDHADYCKYYYEENNTLFSENKSYSAIEDIDEIKGYFKSFEEFISQTERADIYDFDVNIITNDDFVHIETKEGNQIGDGRYEKYDDYSVYLYDKEGCILYYIHLNI